VFVIAMEMAVKKKARWASKNRRQASLLMGPGPSGGGGSNR
jgi:hypothetical protein